MALADTIFFLEITNTLSNQHHEVTIFYCQITFLTKENVLKCILYITQAVMETLCPPAAFRIL